MAKASSPIRLQAEIMQAAAVAAKYHHRSTTEQIEYWAALGRQVSAFIGPDDLLSVCTGTATIKIEPVMCAPVDPGQVFAELEVDRAHGLLSQGVTGSPLRYQASLMSHGYLEQIRQDGTIVLGKFEGGQFVVCPETMP